MKLTKKAAALLLAASLAVSVCATPVFATDGTTLNRGSTSVDSKLIGSELSGSGNTDVLYKVTESYQWSIPATIDFGENAGVDNTSTVEAKLDKKENGEQAKQAADNTWKGTAPKVMVTKNVIRADKKLQITVDTKNHFATSYDKNDGFYVETADTHEKLYFTISKPVEGTTAMVLKGDTNEVLCVPSGTDTDEQELVFVLKTARNNDKHNAAEKAGTYKGLVAFSSKLVD